MSEYGDIWEASAVKCRPSQDWHWAILRRDLAIEHAVLRGLWMMQFLPGRTFAERVPKAQVREFFGRRSLLDARLRDWSIDFDCAVEIIAKDSKRIIAALSAKFRECGQPIPSSPLLGLSP